MERNIEYDLCYSTAIYCGIVDAIRFEIEFPTEDKRKIFKYMVDRYTEEELVSATYLKEELSKYMIEAEKLYGKEENHDSRSI